MNLIKIHYQIANYYYVFMQMHNPTIIRAKSIYMLHPAIDVNIYTLCPLPAYTRTRVQAYYNTAPSRAL